MSEKELTQEELERVAGGKRKMQAGRDLQEQGTDAAANEVEIQDATPLGDPLDPRG